VSVFPTEPDANPLQEWLESLASIAEHVPDDVLVLPSHNEPFRGLHARLKTLISGHEQRLTLMREQLATPKRAIDLFAVLFRRRVGADMLIMATGESVAHLNCLIARQLVVRELDSGGVAWYRRA
jgi:glyoxylase-like metal-dependent hydrolase (beta-lactamase superfamily II)